jgi:hypothetical protein
MADLFRAVVDQPTVLKLGVMTASLPLQDFRSDLHLIAGRTFTNYREDLRFCHSGLKARKPFVHLTTDAHHKRDNYQECSIHDVNFTNGGHILQPSPNTTKAKKPCGKSRRSPTTSQWWPDFGERVSE